MPAEEHVAGLGIWFREDIRNALMAAEEASAATAFAIGEVAGPHRASTPELQMLRVALRAYREGFKAALSTISLAFGLAPQIVALRPPEQEEEKPCGLSATGSA